MPEYLAPGVYVEEVEIGAKPIEGVSTSTAGFLGETERGPLAPRLVTSFPQFERTYGGFDQYRKGGRLQNTYLAYAVEGFFRNGGKRCFVGRVAGKSSTAASGSLQAAQAEPSPAMLVAERSAVDMGLVTVGERSSATVTLRNVGGEDAVIGPDRLELDVDDGTEDDEFSATVEEGSVAAGGEVPVDVTFEPTSAGLKGATLGVADMDAVSVRFESGASTGPLGASRGLVEFDPIDVGETQQRSVTLQNGGEEAVAVPVENVTVVSGDGTEDDEFDFRLSDLADGDDTLRIPPGESSRVEVTFAPASEGPKSAVIEVTSEDIALVIRLRGGESEDDDAPAVAGDDDARDVIGVTCIGPGTWGNNVVVVVENATRYDSADGENALFKLTVHYWSTAEKKEAALEALGARDSTVKPPTPSLTEVYDDVSPVETGADYYERVINGTSKLIEVKRLAPGRPRTGTERAPVVATLTGGTDGAVALTDYEGSDDPGERTGLAGFEETDEISIVCVPDEVTVEGLTEAVKDHCENLGDRFAVLQAEEKAARPGSLWPTVTSDYAAFYYPWVAVLDPVTNRRKVVPPGGHVAGIYARTDTQQGVYKAPANEVVRGALGLQHTVSTGDQAVLNPRGVNCIRSFRGRGIRVWGARTTSSDPSWKYVNVRRLFLYLEESIDEGTQWVVFEPNDEMLWARVRQTVTNFLTTAWRDGALMGTTPEEAFFVKCDRSTMTQDDIDNGRLVVQVGVAPVKPAEFVIFRIAQWTGGAEGA